MTRVDARYYDESGYFDAGAEKAASDSRFQAYRVEKVLDIHLPSPEDRVLDLGCAWGTFSFTLAPRVRQIVGVDFSERAVAYCQTRSRELGLDNVRFVRADARDTGLAPASFDVIIAADFFEHVYADESAEVVRECFRLLVPEGRFMIWLPNRGHFLEILKNRNILLKRDPSHVDYKSIRRMQELLLGAGFDVEKAYFVESHLPFLRSIERLLLPLVPVLRRRIAILARKPPR